MAILRWVMLAVLMFGWGASQMQWLSVMYATPRVEADLGLTLEQVRNASLAVPIGVVAGCVLMTVLTALAGARWGLTVGFAGMALASLAWTLAGNPLALTATLFAFGFFTAALIPAMVQTVGEWFSRPLRPLAIALILASYHASAIPTAFLFPTLTEALGWRGVVAATGLLGLVVAALCLVFAILVKEPPAQQVSTGLSAAGLVTAGTLALGLGLAATVFRLCVLWLPSYLRETLGAAFHGSDAAAAAMFNTAGALGGALLSGAIACILMYAGLRPSKTRAALLTACGCLLPLAAAVGLLKVPFAVLLLGFLVAGGYHGVMTILFSAVADTLPVRGIVIAAAIGNLTMTLSLVLSPLIMGPLKDRVGFEPAFLLVGGVGALAWLVVALPAWFIRQEAAVAPTAQAAGVPPPIH